MKQRLLSGRDRSLADMVPDRGMRRPGMGTGGDYQEAGERYIFCTKRASPFK